MIDFKKLETFNEWKKIRACDCKDFLVIKLKAWAKVSDHSHKESETIYLIEGEINFQIADQKSTIKWPCKFTIPWDTYHVWEAVTDILAIEIK